MSRHCYTVGMAKKITVNVIVNEPVEKVWAYYTDPKRIVKWNHASDDWLTARAENDLRVGGRFVSRMEAKDGSEGFDFSGVYREVVPNKKISYVMDGKDKREAVVTFEEIGNSTAISVTFDAEKVNPIEKQREGWEAILKNFKDYTETH